MSMLQDAYIVSAVRSAVARSQRGALAHSSPVTYGADVARAALERVSGLEAERLDDVLMGCAMPEGEQGLNIARQIALRAGFPDSVPGCTVNRFCASGLQTIATAAMTVASGQARAILAGGAESMTWLPMEGLHFVGEPELVAREPSPFISMGMTAERVADEHQVSREDQDAFALQSHQRAVAAQQADVFADEIVPLHVRRQVEGPDGPSIVEQDFAVDEGPRPDSSAEALAKLRPVFRKGGSVTAGNASQTSDGAAAAVVVDAGLVEELDLVPLARLASFAVSGVAPDVMGIGPVKAIPAALARAGIERDDVARIELNEAFASQALAVMRALELDPERVNVHGGAIALGHPLGCTGAKLTATLLHELARSQQRWGVVSMCVGGGMGAAAVFENLRV